MKLNVPFSGGPAHNTLRPVLLDSNGHLPMTARIEEDDMVFIYLLRSVRLSPQTWVSCYALSETVPDDWRKTVCYCRPEFFEIIVREIVTP